MIELIGALAGSVLSAMRDSGRIERKAGDAVLGNRIWSFRLFWLMG
jgi:hypothetical protein